MKGAGSKNEMRIAMRSKGEFPQTRMTTSQHSPNACWFSAWKAFGLPTMAVYVSIEHPEGKDE